MKNFKVELPKVHPGFKEAKFREIYHDEDPYLIESALNGDFIENEDVEKLVLSKVTFNNVTMMDSSFYKVDITDVVFENCDLSNTSFKEGILFRVLFKDCKLMGLDLEEANLRNVTFENCKLDMSAFVDADLKPVLFENCYGAKLSKVKFNSCNIEDIDFTETVLTGIDISTCKFENINVDMKSLKGCIVSREQAIGFSTLLGLKVREE